MSFVIDRFGDEIAARYLAHDVVSMRDSIVNEYRHEGKTYDPDKLKGYLKEAEDSYQQAIAEFGKSFAGSYGWAAHNLGLKSPRFQDLEKAVDWDSLPPNYKWSSFSRMDSSVLARVDKILKQQLERATTILERHRQACERLVDGLVAGFELSGEEVLTALNSKTETARRSLRSG
ncbi:hypothetical protein J2045_002993 [Peteryoungia aggregata LMG 23059]|uniref:Uncharacterized protein n=1 Tax=Peteryoungia aggregata LMG 23059 TaxID=1368425 RepID=A0ABU0G9B9_9HYPH|nr:hypothetical protein [Peteryoungia aggregata LMG 23059]